MTKLNKSTKIKSIKLHVTGEKKSGFARSNTEYN